MSVAARSQEQASFPFGAFVRASSPHVGAAAAAAALRRDLVDKQKLSASAFDESAVGILSGMTLKRMDNVGVVVDDLAAAVAFFKELGLELEGEAQVEGRSVDRHRARRRSIRHRNDADPGRPWPC